MLVLLHMLPQQRTEPDSSPQFKIKGQIHFIGKSMKDYGPLHEFSSHFWKDKDKIHQQEPKLIYKVS